MGQIDILKYGNRSLQASLLKKKPSEYMNGGQIYYHSELRENLLPYVIERVGKDQILYASDYTQEPDLDEATQEVEARKDLLDIAKRKILSDNGKQFYKMEV